MSAQENILVADIGGTNARFALAHVGNEITLDHIKILPTNEYERLEDAVEDFLANIDEERPKKAAIAVAGPIVEDRVKMTNCCWRFLQSDLAKVFAMDEVMVLNDFEAIACAIPYLDRQNILQVGTGSTDPKGNIVVVGPGTGIGVAALTPVGDGWKILTSEGGHAGFAPASELEQDVLKVVSKDYPRVSVERLISGKGLAVLYQALGTIKGVSLPPLRSSEITAQALKNADEYSVQTLDMFCAILGSFAGDLAVTFKATGGVYLAGGILPRIQEFFLKSRFRQRFGDKGRMGFVKDIATYQIVEQHPALIGSAAKTQGKFL